MKTLLLDLTSWDLVLDANGNIALASEPYALAQDAASAIQTFLGECWWDTTVGVPWLRTTAQQQPGFGGNGPLSALKAMIVAAALTVPGVTSARCIISSVSGRSVTGQIQVTSATTSTPQAAPFSVTNPIGVG